MMPDEEETEGIKVTSTSFRKIKKKVVIEDQDSIMRETVNDSEIDDSFIIKNSQNSNFKSKFREMVSNEEWMKKPLDVEAVQDDLIDIRNNVEQTISDMDTLQ